MDEGPSNHSNRRVLSTFTLAMINVAAIVSLSNLPTIAELGLESVFFLVLAVLLFFIPTALVSAELSTGWSEGGGVYAWVKAAFGDRWGFLAIWLLWFKTLTFYPTMLSFIAATLAFAWNPALADSQIYTLVVVLVIFWGATFANFRGMKTSGWITTACVIMGTLVPGALVIFLGALWFVTGKQLDLSLSGYDLVPHLSNIREVGFFAAVFLFFAGIEMSACHAREVNDPQKDYPKAILFSTSAVLTLYVLGTLAIAAVVPQRELSLVAGLMEAFTNFFAAYKLSWLVPVVALLLVFGAIGTINAWILGPAKGLLVTAEDGNLPSLFQKTNNNGIPTNLLITQALIVTVVSLVFLLMPSVSASFYLLVSLSAHLYLIMYILMFAAAIRLRYQQPGVERAYRIPGGNAGMWLVAGLGILAAAFAIGVGFLPPTQVDTGSTLFYVCFLVLGILVVCLVPFVSRRLRRSNKDNRAHRDGQ